MSINKAIKSKALIILIIAPIAIFGIILYRTFHVSVETNTNRVANKQAMDTAELVAGGEIRLRGLEIQEEMDCGGKGLMSYRQDKCDKAQAKLAAATAEQAKITAEAKKGLTAENQADSLYNGIEKTIDFKSNRYSLPNSIIVGSGVLIIGIIIGVIAWMRRPNGDDEDE